MVLARNQVSNAFATKEEQLALRGCFTVRGRLPDGSSDYADAARLCLFVGGVKRRSWCSEYAERAGSTQAVMTRIPNKMGLEISRPKLFAPSLPVAPAGRREENLEASAGADTYC
jgi:hypothetical protein